MQFVKIVALTALGTFFLAALGVEPWWAPAAFIFAILVLYVILSAREEMKAAPKGDDRFKMDRKCAGCGAKIMRSARICPSCGRRQ